MNGYLENLFAVIFIALAAGKSPHYYVIALPLVLLILRPVLYKLLEKLGHGELLFLNGFFVALIIGAELFKFDGLKPKLVYGFQSQSPTFTITPFEP